ncbi:hypothetical protein N8H22_09960 [Stutzerimonas stutzeri]|uniref:hypothetical protein n=1 Tax=Stutzerimonas sp. S1 TaxID=3030652 RepID=UPI00222461D2|nr:hypothetical protein [Stutzerimonas sp. S1]MCW3148916.1 hypothetical protein [Stutzerimonas sp. S1]
MNLTEILGVSGAVLGSLGGGALIIFGFSNWLGKVWANRLMEKEKADHTRALEALRTQLTQETESYKIKLKKSEFIFEREFEATSEFVNLLRSILPPLSHPQMDWDEACEEIAHDFKNIEKLLSLFMSKHGAVLGAEAKKLISSALGLAAHGKFLIQGPEVPRSASESANTLFEKLAKAEDVLLQQVHSQSST